MTPCTSKQNATPHRCCFHWTLPKQKKNTCFISSCGWCLRKYLNKIHIKTISFKKGVSLHSHLWNDCNPQFYEKIPLLGDVAFFNRLWRTSWKPIHSSIISSRLAPKGLKIRSPLISRIKISFQPRCKWSPGSTLASSGIMSQKSPLQVRWATFTTKPWHDIPWNTDWFRDLYNGFL